MTIQQEITPIQSSKIGKWWNGIAGEGVRSALFSAVEIITLGHICDRIKVERQANFERSQSLWKTISKIKSGGVSKLYEGLRWNLINNCSKYAFRGVAFSSVDAFYSDKLPKEWRDSHPALQPFCVGFTLASLETPLFACVTEAMKIRNMTTQQKGRVKIMQLIKDEGIKGLYKSLFAVYVRNMTSWISYQLADHYIRVQVQSFTGKPRLSFSQEFAVSGLAGAVNAMIVAPFDTIKTQIQKENALLGKNYLDVARQIYKAYGIRGFWVGAGVKTVRSIWWTAIMMTPLKIKSQQDSSGASASS